MLLVMTAYADKYVIQIFYTRNISDTLKNILLTRHEIFFQHFHHQHQQLNRQWQITVHVQHL